MDVGGGSHTAGFLHGAARNQNGSLRNRKRSDGLPCANHDRNCFRIYLAATAPLDPAGQLCKLSPGFGVHRDLWGHLLFGDATRARDRNSHGAWRGEAGYFSPGRRARPKTGFCRPDHWDCSRADSHAPPVELFAAALRSESERPVNVRLCLNPADRCGRTRLLHPSSAGDACRSHGRAEIRIVRRSTKRQPFLSTTAHKRSGVADIPGDCARGFVLTDNSEVMQLLQTAPFARVSARTNCGTTVFLESDGICVAAIIWRAVLRFSGYFVVERR